MTTLQAALSSVIFQPTSPICDYRTPADSIADRKVMNAMSSVARYHVDVYFG